MQWWNLLILSLLCVPCLGAESSETVEFANGHRLILVPAGGFFVGQPQHLRNPQRQVKLKAFAIAEAETTNAQFAEFVAATGYVSAAEVLGFGKVALEGMADWEWEQIRGAHWRKPRGEDGPAWEEIPQHPVTQISAVDAEAYSRWIGARLPTLEEWEVAARAGAATLYPWGEEFDPLMANVWGGKTHVRNERSDGHIYTAPVKSFRANAWGLYDVIGNVFEYCHGVPRGAEPGDERRLIAGRGGSWWCSFGTCGFFNLIDIGTMDRRGSLSNQGFRIALTPGP